MLSDDLRHSIRSLRRAPGLTIVVVLTAALGIGAGTSLFSVVKAVLLNPLPYPEAGRLAWISSLYDGAETRTSLADFDDWRARSFGFSAMAAYGDANLLVGGGREAEQVQGAMVTEEFFDLLGVRPALGRALGPAEHHSRAPFAGVVLSHGLWQRAYGSDPQAVGRKITVLGLPATVVGVMPKGFAYPPSTDIWFSARAVGEGAGRAAHNYWVIGRRKPGLPIESARTDLQSIVQRLAKEYAGPYQTSGVAVASLAEHWTGNVRIPLLILFAAVGLLLAIVCVNIANLLLVRMTARSGELAVRAALGAEASRLFRQLLAESLVLAIAGGALGMLFAAWSVDLLRVLLPTSIPRAADVRIDGGVIVFAVLATALAGVLFGTFPSWMASRQGISETLKGLSRSHSFGRRVLRVQAMLVVSEVALSVLLLAGGGLLLSSFARLRAVDPGFRTDRVIAATISWPAPEARRLTARYRDVLERVRALPGVTSAGVLREVPLDPVQRRGAVRIQSRPDLPAAQADYVIASPGSLEVLRVRLIRGRLFTESDAAEAPPVVLVNQKMARRFWPGRDPLGEKIWFTGFEGKEHWLTVVGVTGDMRENGLTEPVREQAWVCYSQLQTPGYLISGSLVVRSSANPGNLVGAIRKAVRDVSPNTAVSFRRLDDVLAAATSRQRFQLQVLATFAILALLLAGIGLYGVISYAVTANRSAIGIRMALGARPADIIRLFLGRALLWAGLGAAIGVAGCLACGELLARVVYGVAPSDPLVLGGAALIMALWAVLACAIPISRASRTDPLSALRME